MAGMKPTDFDARLGERLKSSRSVAKRTQREVAAQIGISAAQLQKYEKGTNAMSARDVQVVSRFLRVPIVAFYDPPGADYEPVPGIEGIPPKRAAEIRALITKIAEMIAPSGPTPWEPAIGDRVRCLGGVDVGVVVWIESARKRAGVRFDNAPGSGQAPGWAFSELFPEPEVVKTREAATEPLARLLYDANTPISLEGDRIVIDFAGSDQPDAAAELYAFLAGATAVAIVERGTAES